MEAEAWEAEGYNLVLDSDLYDADVYDVPDPGLLTEKNELTFTEPSQVLPFLTSSQQWQSLTPRARARRLWLLLRTSLHEVVEKEKRGELRVARLTHGLEPLRRLEVAAGLRSVAQDPVGGRFVVLDGAGRLHLHKEDGWAQETLLAPVGLTGLVTVLGPLGAVGRFVGWGPAGLAILRPNLSLLWLSEPRVGRAPGWAPTCCLPVPDLRLLLVAEMDSSLALWQFRSGGRRLVLRGSPLHPPPSPTGRLMRLAVGPVPPHHVLRCFAAYGSAVLTFDLHAWTLVDVRWDLHKTTISDLAYCEEVEAMVTASRDSTVKVWEANWQIRMVFVGHTGPVTAMAVLPNTTLVVSASQDGTLRTWDLQAAAQVGEVALGYWGQDKLSRRVGRLLAPARPGWPVLSLCASSMQLWSVRELYSPLAQLPAKVLHVQVAPALPAPAHPSLPTRLVCACTDGSVYLLSAATGRIVSSLLLEPEDCAAAVAYCLPREALWLLTKAGHLVRANAARCPMSVLHRMCPPPPPAPQPCCLHLYSHLTDLGGAFSSWEVVRQHQGELRRSAVACACKNTNRYLPVVGHMDGTLSVLDWLSSKTVFQTEAHSPGPVVAMASTWNSIVSSGGDLTVKMWRVFPYAEESLSLLRTFSCCYPAVALCALGRRVTVGFEDPDSATYGLVQFGLGDSPRLDHRPQDDPTDHITGLCCCPTLKLYACSSLDCTIRIWTAENRLLRLLQLNGAPQALTFCSNSGDLVLALGSRLCLVSHRLYLPTSYLVKKMCWKVPDVVDDPPLPLTSQESLTPTQLQRLSNLHRAASLRSHTGLLNPPGGPPFPPWDLDALVARDRDLQQLRLGLVVPAARPPPSWQQRQEGFDNYLRLIYGSGLLVGVGRESQQWSTGTLTVERETWDVCALPQAAHCLARGEVSTAAQTVPTALSPQDLGPLDQHFSHPPRVTVPIPPTHRRVHSKASQLLARSSLSHCLGLSLDLQLQLEQLRGRTTVALDLPSSHLQCRIPLLPKRQPKEPLSSLGGFFPATVQPHKYCLRPICFPGYVPNSVVLQQMWLNAEPGASQDALWLQYPRPSQAQWQRKLLQWLGDKPGEEEEEDQKEEEEKEEVEEELDRASASLSSHSSQQLDSWELEEQSAVDWTREPRRRTYETARTHPHPWHRHGSLLLDEHYAHLPKFLHFFIYQTWFKELFPVFNLQAYPEAGTVEGLASLLVAVLEETTWVDRVHILQVLLRLLPNISSDLQGQLQGLLIHLLNLDQPPSLQDQTQKKFVMLALQLLLACSLESRDVVLELMSYFLYSPVRCRPELKKLLHGLGLQDPEGFLFKEMMTWVQSSDLDSKAGLRTRCCQKLEDMIQQLQETPSQTSVVSGAPTHASVMPSGTSWSPSSIFRRLSQVSEVPSMVVSPVEPHSLSPELQAQQTLAPTRSWVTGQLGLGVLSETLKSFCLEPEARLGPAGPAQLPEEPPLLEETDWSHSQLLDLGPIHALNFFCQQLRAQQRSSLQEEAAHPYPPVPDTVAPVPDMVVPPPREHWYHPILRLQEAKAQRSARCAMRLRGPVLSRLCARRTLDGPIRTLKLPLPRVEPQPFPRDWPTPPRPLPPRLLQPALQRYFLPEDADPDTYG
uniref:repressor of RNA polymerase III transcription MAF1 homolog isoform X8 n=1 Tax=Macaca mulatta TaxID=9544 RepID=UPI0010A26566|nr:repressor of RNA polymerase III transcription MAF1 homolog isoform X8 [Macaca mulatta]